MLSLYRRIRHRSVHGATAVQLNPPRCLESKRNTDRKSILKELRRGTDTQDIRVVASAYVRLVPDIAVFDHVRVLAPGLPEIGTHDRTRRHRYLIPAPYCSPN